MSGFELPPALAGSNNEVTPDADGASNFAYFVGGLTLTLVGAGAAVAIKDRIMDAAPTDAAGSFNVSVN